MNPQIIEYEDLKKLHGGSTIEEVKINLMKARIPFNIGKRGQPYTVIKALEQSIGIETDASASIADQPAEIEVL